MQIVQYTPPPLHPLHPYVATIWRIDSQQTHTQEIILPKQNVDILFNFGVPERIVQGQSTRKAELKDFHVAGPQTSAFIAQPQGDVHLLGVSLKMESCSAIFPLPLTEITDLTVEGSCIFPKQRFLWEQVAEAQNFDAQCTLLMCWLMTLFQPTPHLGLVQHACWSLREQPTSHTLDQLSTNLNISSRHLRRVMLRHVGIGPAHYMRLSRFVKAIYMMPKIASLTEIAYNVHYADQAHFCRDFKEIAGMTPHEYRQRMSRVPGHIFVT